MMTTTEDLYREIPCPNCGQMRLAVVSFCPHCGAVSKAGWLEKITKQLKSGGPEGASEGAGKRSIPLLMGLLVAVYFLYVAITEGSVQGYVIAALSIMFLLRSLFSDPKSASPGAVEGVRGGSSASEEVPGDNFFCENCGTKVSEDATECPKCGMKFGA